MIRTRFAPSPTGLLHIGHAYAARQAFEFAKKNNGECLLRIENIDAIRCKPEFEQAIYDDLSWLGFDWPKPVRRQSEHLSEYQQALKTLIDKDLVYRCFKTRSEILSDIARAPHSVDNVYFGEKLPEDEEQELLAQGKEYAWRLSIKKARDYLGNEYNKLFFVNNNKEIKAKPDVMGDIILARKDIGTSYHLACTYDDNLQKITDIVRGEDLFLSTHIHRLLQALLGWHTPLYHHHKLLRDKQGKRFAKRDKSITIKAMRTAGKNPMELF